MKKNLLFLCLACVFTLQAWGQERPFITQWIVNEGSSITIGLNTAYNYDFSYEWKSANGTIVSAGDHTSADGAFVTTFSSNGVYTLEITGTFPHFREYPKVQFQDVLQWGDIAWESMSESFRDWPGSSFSAVDVPDLSNVKTMWAMFFDASSFNDDLSNWDVSNVEFMAQMFVNATSFNGDLSNWNVSNVTNMFGMLSYTDLSDENYDKLLISWSQQDVQHGVQLGAATLKYCSGGDARSRLIYEFGWEITGDQPGSSNCPFFLTYWFVAAGQTIRIELHPDFAYDFTYTWRNAGTHLIKEGRYTSEGGGSFETTFTEQLPFLTLEITGTFPHFRSNDQLLDVRQWGDINWKSFEASFKDWQGASFNASDVPDLSDVTNMSRAFKDATAFNQPLKNWDVSKVEDMSEMFEGASAFNKNLNNWNVSRVKNMNEMFKDATSFNSELFRSDLRKVEDMSSMFEGAESFDKNINHWDMENVKDVSSMFKGAISFDQDLNEWDVREVKFMNNMFEEAIAFNGRVNAWNTRKVTDMSSMFRGASDFNKDVNNWKVEKVENMRDMFRSAKAFNKGVNAWDVDNVKDMSGMFYKAKKFNKELNKWDVRKVEGMSEMFYEARAFNKPLKGWKIRRVEDMSDMFSGAVKFDRKLSDWDVTSVTNMARMFDESDMGTGNYDDLLKGWSRQNVQPGVTLGARGLTYCQQADAREKLINDFGWTIVGDNECNSRSNTSFALAVQDTLKHTAREAHEHLALSEANSAPVSDIEGLSIYPNPAADLLYIESSAPVDVSLKDLQGIEWYTEKAAHAFELDITGLNTGVYLLILQYPDRTVTRKIVKVSE